MMIALLLHLHLSFGFRDLREVHLVELLDQLVRQLEVLLHSSSFFASYSPFVCPITSLESLLRSRFLALKALPILSPISMASYSASLLVAGN